MENTREQYTIRIPTWLIEKVRRESRLTGEPINDIVVSATEKEIRRRNAARTLEQIGQRRRKIAARGKQPDSVPIIRSLREGVDRR